MLKFFFTKYVYNGNSYLISDLSSVEYKLLEHQLPSLIKKWCSFTNGIYSDGVIFLIDKNKIQFYNSDGTSALFCGNGFRMINYHFFKQFPYLLKHEIYHNHKKYIFINDKNNTIIIEKPLKTSTLIDLGNKHLLIPLTQKNLKKAAELANKYHANIGFYLIINDNFIYLRTYELGIGWSYSCGSNAIALALFIDKELLSEYQIFNEYGKITVEIKKDQVILKGKVHLVCEGILYSI